MSIIEIHLILNHIPIIGVALVGVYLFIGIIFKNIFMQKVSLWLLLSLALVTVAVYFSGLGAEAPAKSLPNVSSTYLQLHEKVARIATITIVLIGGIILLGLVLLKNRDQLFTYFVRGVFAMTLLSTGLFILTGYLGGQITHSEIRSTLAEGISTRAITLGVIAIMAVIVIALVVPLLLHRNQVFKKAEQDTTDEAEGWQGRLEQDKQNPWNEQGRADSINPSWERPLQGSTRSPLPNMAASSPIEQLSGQLSIGTSLQWSNIQGPSVRFQQNTLPTGSTPLQPNSRPDGSPWTTFVESDANKQIAFPTSQQRNGSTVFENGALRAQEYRPLTEENTRPMPIASPQPRPFPIKHLHSKPLKGRKGLLVAIGLLGVVILLGGLGFTVFHLLKPALPLQVVADIPLTGGPNRFDYQYLDPNTRLLYITHSASDMVTIFDTSTRKIVADVSGIKDPHDAALAADLGRVFVTSATGNLVAVIDEQTYSVVARIPVGDSPDGLVYDPADHRIFVADETGQNVAVIDAQTERLITEIPLGGDAGDVEYDVLSHRVFAVVEKLNQLVTIDPATGKIIARDALPGCQTGQDLVIDGFQRLALVDCADNAMLVMVDMRSMKIIASQSVGKSPDLMALDSNRHYLYVASESGVISVFNEQGRMLQKLNEGYVASGAHTVAVDSETHYIYLPLQNVNGKPVLRIALFQP